MDTFQQQEMKKIRQIKKYWFDQLIKQSVRGKKPKIIRDKLKDKIISDTWKQKKKKKKEKKRSITKE